MGIEALQVEMSSLLVKVVMGHVEMLQDQGDGICTPTIWWPPCALVGSTPFSTSVDSTRVSKFCMETLFSWVFTKVGGWCHWISRMPSCLYRFTPVTGGIFGLPSGTQQWSSLLNFGRFSLFSPFWSSHFSV